MCRRDFEKKNLKSGSGGIWTRDLLHAKFYSIKNFEDTNFYFIKIMSLVFWKFEDEHSPAQVSNYNFCVRTKEMHIWVKVSDSGRYWNMSE